MTSPPIARLALDPAGGFLTVAVCGAVLIALLWIGPARERISAKRRRTLAFLRLATTIVAILAMLRPSVVYTETTKTPASIFLLADVSRSMNVEDAGANRTRFGAAKAALEAAAGAIAEAAKILDVQVFAFDRQPNAVELTDGAAMLPEAADGPQSAIGASIAALNERNPEKRIAAMIVLSDFAQRAYVPYDSPAPQTAVQLLAARSVPLYSIALGQDRSLGQTRDVALENLSTNQPVFVKNVLEARVDGRFMGMANQDVVVQFLVESAPGSGAMSVISAETVRPSGADETQTIQFEFTPVEPGEYKIALRAQPQVGELVTVNNEISTFVTVHKGGLNVLYLEGVARPEQSFLRRALDESPDIRIDYLGLRSDRPNESRPRDLAERFERGKYDVYIFGDLDSIVFKPGELETLAATIEAGAGFMMTGGGNSFGPGGYSETPLADVLPVAMDRLERQRISDPVRPDVHRQGKIKMIPTPDGLQESMLRLAVDPTENAKLWDALPQLNGANKLVRQAASQVFAVGPADEPLLVARDYHRGRVLAFAGDSTWRWVIAGRKAEHKRFWRQTILWLARKDKNADNMVWIRLDQRRFAPGGRVDFTAGADSADGQPLTDVTFEAEVLLPGGGKSRVELREQKPETAGEYRAPQTAGDYTLLVRAKRQGQVVGENTARFVVFEQDLELDNPAADHGLAESLAATTGGKRVAPEQLPELFEEIVAMSNALDIVRETVLNLYDNVVFLSVFVGLLVTEWYLRKRWGLA